MNKQANKGIYGMHKDLQCELYNRACLMNRLGIILIEEASLSLRKELKLVT